MKKTKRMIAMICAVVTILSCFAMFAGAASITSDKHTATGIKGGQTVYVTSNTGWNYWMPMYTTKLTITIPKDFRELYQYNGLEQVKRIQVTTYKKTSNKWVKQNDLSGKYYCDGYTGILSKTFKLSGSGVQYKIVITPEYQVTVERPSDMTGIKAQINYGRITSVS